MLVTSSSTRSTSTGASRPSSSASSRPTLAASTSMSRRRTRPSSSSRCGTRARCCRSSGSRLWRCLLIVRWRASMTALASSTASPTPRRRPLPAASKKKKGKTTDVEYDVYHTLWVTNQKDNEFGNLYGFPLIGHAYRFWWSYWFLWANLDRAFERMAVPPLVAYHPEGDYMDEDTGERVPYWQIAIEAAERLRSNAVAAVPGTIATAGLEERGTQQREWEFKFLETPSNNFTRDRVAPFLPRRDEAARVLGARASLHRGRGRNLEPQRGSTDGRDLPREPGEQVGGDRRPHQSLCPAAARRRQPSRVRQQWRHRQDHRPRLRAGGRGLPQADHPAHRPGQPARPTGRCAHGARAGRRAAEDSEPARHREGAAHPGGSSPRSRRR